ncbi:MAG: pilus assembly protein [Pseudomonadota bacterium]
MKVRPPVASHCQKKSQDPKGFLRQLRHFTKREDGNVAIWFSILLVPMLGFSFGAIKFAEMARYRSDLIDALDASALAIARRADRLGLDACDLQVRSDGTVVLQDEYNDLIKYGQEFFIRNFPGYKNLYGTEDLATPFSASNHLDFKITCSTVNPSAVAYVDMGPVLGEFFDLNEIQIGTDTEISLPGSGRIELALVLDVTGSMNSCASVGGGSCGSSNKRINVLKSAVDDMMDTLYGDDDDSSNPFVKVGIVPFSSTVNINPDYFYRDAAGTLLPDGQAWMDIDAESVWHGSNFFHLEYDDSSGVADSGNWFDIDVDRKVNHFDLFNSIDRSHAEWKGCVEARPFPLDETDDEPGTSFTQANYNAARLKPSDLSIPDDTPSSTISRINKAWNEAPNPAPTKYSFADLSHEGSTRFVPWFAPDEPDCNNNACGGYSSLDNWQRDFNLSTDGASFPAWFLDGPKSHDNHKEGSYANRHFVGDASYTNVRHGDRASTEVYRNLVMHYRTVYEKHFWVDGDSTYPDGSTKCNAHNFSWGHDPIGDQGMVDAINKFKAYECMEREYRIRQAYVGVWDSGTNTYTGKYDDSNGYGSNNDHASNREIAIQGPNYECSTPLLPLTTQKRDVVDKMASLIPGGSTNTAVGAIWGWRILSPGAPFTEGSNPNTSEGRRWRKFMVLMTDGQNNLAHADTHNMSRYSPYGYVDEDRLNLLDASDTKPSDIDNIYENEFDNKTVRICHRARQEGIKIYTIGFAISSGSNVEKALQACAIDEDAYFRAENSDALHEAFGKITDQIVELHISG